MGMDVELEPLIAWIRKREELRLRKVAGLRPWTDDPILAQYRFCNVRRRDDRISQWILNNVIERTEKHDWNLLKFVVLCRWVNWPPTIREWLDAKLWPSAQPDWRAIGSMIELRTQRGEQSWTGVFMVHPEKPSNGNYFSRWPKGNYIAEIVVERELTNHRTDIEAALALRLRSEVSAILESLYGWGPFMAGQVIDDWSWTSAFQNPLDNYSWAPKGPGSLRGANRLLGNTLRANIPDNQWAALLPYLRKEILCVLGQSYDNLTCMDLQNCLCEFDKYERARLGEGRPRNIYKPETRY